MFKKVLPVMIGISLAMSSATISTTAVAAEAKSNKFWWPEQLNLSPLRDHDNSSAPLNEEFDYAAAFNSLDLDAVKADIEAVLTDSQDWWPADYGNYGPFFIRMAWHAAGTYRTHDGRGGAGGGQQRFAPLNSWPDNVSLDKARRLIWPVKQKYGRAISWGDLIALTGNVALESMGFKTFGFAGGRVDDWEPDTVYWGPEAAFLTDERRADGKLKGDLAAVEMGLIYVNPEGPHGNPDPLLAAKDIRMSFDRMAMDDEEIVALIAGGHTLGKAHGAHKPGDCVGPEPEAAAIEQQGFGWKNKCGKGHSEDTVSSGLEGAWTLTPTQWTTNYLDNLFGFTWVQTKSPAGATQWIPDTEAASQLVPDAHDPTKRHAPIMFTTDLALKKDPSFSKIAERFRANPAEFDRAFGRAWFKLNHRDLGPRARYLGKEVPQEVLTWQDPVPAVDHPLINEHDIASLKKAILDTGLTVPQLVTTAWASAASFRVTDMRGGANGARLHLAPQNEWSVNNPEELAMVLPKLHKVQKHFNSGSSDRKVSFADVIVLAGAAGIEHAAKANGHDITVPFKPGRSDASQEHTSLKSFAYLELKADAFRNYYSEESHGSPVDMMVDKADKLALTVPEMTVLVGGMRAMHANADMSNHGVFTDKPGTLSNDFFVNLLDMSTQWKPSEKHQGLYEGLDRQSGELKWMATPVDLIFGSNSELRAVAEFYAADDSKDQFVHDFVGAWTKVMTLDRFDLK